MYQSTKTYGSNLGLSCAFRQWRADSHCNKIHGYALEVKLVFEAYELDVRNWVLDFGGLKEVKNKLERFLDHKTLVAKDDPHMDWFEEAENRGMIDMVIVEAAGCEATAKRIYDIVCEWLKENNEQRVTLASVEVREHGANSAVYIGPCEPKVYTPPFALATSTSY